MPLPKEQLYTTDYIYSLPEGQRAELIDGVIYDMAPSNRLHQDIEVIFPGTKRTDYGVKLFKYRSAGVREYWIVNPLTKTVNVFDLEKEELNDQYSFDDDITACIYNDLTINISELLK